MQIPNTTLTTHVEYSVDNDKICSVSGTKTVAQITGIAAGTTTVRAKLVATSTNTVQASAEMLVYVKEAATNAVYITASSTIITLNKGKSQTLSATLSGSGITTSDQYNLKWKTKDTDCRNQRGRQRDRAICLHYREQTGRGVDYLLARKSRERIAVLCNCSGNGRKDDYAE